MARIDDGYQTLISFSEAPSVKFYEKGVQPPGIDGGGPVDTTTMRNSVWRTMNPKHLKSLTEGKITVAYDPAVYDDIVAMCNVNQLITIAFPDGSTLAFWGYLNSFAPGELQEGEQPTADVSIQPTNQDDSGVETAPVYTAA